MSASSRGLGRGLDALFKGNELDTASSENDKAPSTLLVRQLRANPNQPRKHFTDEALEELASSIRSQGVLQPLLVRPQNDGTEEYYEIVAGERRWRASKLAGIREVPVVIKELSDLETLAVGLIENLQREDLNPMEEALGMHELKEKFALSQEDLAKKLGKSRSAIANTLRLLQLDEQARKYVQAGQLSAGHARALLAVDEDMRADFCHRIITDKLTVREAEALVQHWKAYGCFPDTLGNAGGGKLPARAVPSITPFMQDVQGKLCDSLNLKVKLSGSEDKGKLTLSFSNQQELSSLLARLGIEVGDS